MAGNRYFSTVLALLVFSAAGCRAKRVQAPPPPPPPPPVQNVIALLPDSEGKAGGIVVSNSAGSQELNQAYQAVRVERADAAPSAPFTIDAAEVKRLFGSALDVLPTAEVSFILYFVEGKDELTAESEKQLPTILATIQERQSTAISVTGHTDTTGDQQANYRLGLRRAERVSGILKAEGIEASSLFADSHGEADLLVKTARGVAEQRNRRVEVVVR